MSQGINPFPQGEALVDIIADIFCTDQLFTVKELGIVPEDNPPSNNNETNKSIHWQDGNLGISSWAISSLCFASSKRLWKNVSDIRAATALLIADPAYNTAWNTRKKRFNLQHLSQELRFSTIMLTFKPKCAEAWSHRAWLIRTCGVDHISCQNELDLANITASRYKSNYYAGVHRLRIITFLSYQQRNNELIRQREWLKTHIYDSSGWWYYKALLQSIYHSQYIPKDEIEWFQNISSTYEKPCQSIKVLKQWISSNHNNNPSQ